MTDGRDTELEEMLNASAPTTTRRTDERADALRAMVSATRPRRRLRPRVGVAIAGGIALLGVGGVAAAEGLGWTVPWADEAVNEVTYTLPSGAVCTGIYGGFWGGPLEVEAAEAVMSRPDLIETLDIDRHYDGQRAKHYTATLEDGSRVPAGPGTPYWSDDEVYHRAVTLAASDAIWDEIDARGIESDILEWQSDSQCPGMVYAELSAPETWSR